MIPEKMIDVTNLYNHVSKIENLIARYETLAQESEDRVCRSFLKNIADKKCIQLMVIETMLRKRGIEIFPYRSNKNVEQSFAFPCTSDSNLETIYDFVSKQSLNDLKALLFLSVGNHVLKPIFKAMGELEEDFLNFVEGDYLHHLCGSTQSNAVKNTLLASAG